MDQYKRQTAYMCTAQQINEGEFVKQEGWEPSFLLINNKMFSRVRVLGIIVEHNPSETLIDDGTGTCVLRSFNGSIPELPVGTPLMIIGRPRAYGDQKYVFVEIARKVSPHWIKHFKAEQQELQSFVLDAPKKEAVTASPSVPEKKLDKNSLIDIIRELDPGDGAAVDEVLTKYGLPDAEEKLQFLITQGEVFELRAGKIKVLE